MADPRLSGCKVALIGGTESAGKTFETMLSSAGAQLSFREHGRKEQWSPSEIAGQVNTLGCDFIFLAVTPPFGDLFAKALIDEGASAFIVGVGGGLDMLVGHRKRAPQVVQRLNLEWIFRLIQDPKHLWKRYVVQCIPAYAAMLRERQKR